MPRKTAKKTPNTNLPKTNALLALMEMVLECDRPYGDAEDRWKLLLLEAFPVKSYHENWVAHANVEDVEDAVGAALGLKSRNTYQPDSADQARVRSIARRFVHRVLGVEELTLDKLGIKLPKPAKAPAEKKPASAAKPKRPKKGPAAAKKPGKKPASAASLAKPKGRAKKASSRQRAGAPAAATSAVHTGSHDPKYAAGLAHLRSLGRIVEDAYAVDELEGELEIPLERAEALFDAMKAAGDWPVNGAAPSQAKATDAPGAKDPMYAKALAWVRKTGPKTLAHLEAFLEIDYDRASAIMDALCDAGEWPELGRARGPLVEADGAAEPEKGRGGPRTTDPLFDAAERFVAEQARQGRKPSASGLKKALNVGHGRATALLEQVQRQGTLPA